MSKQKAEDKHKRIQAKMNDGIEWESIELAAKILEKKNPEMKAFAQIMKPKSDSLFDVNRNSDEGDILLFDKKTFTKKDGFRHYRVMAVEVKRLTKKNGAANFTCREDYPFPDFIVDGVQQFDKKVPTPYQYFCFNEPLTAVIVCYIRTFDNWTIRDRAGNETVKPYYVAQLKDVKFFTVKELLTNNVKQN